MRAKWILLGLTQLFVIVFVLYVGLWKWGFERTWVPVGRSLQLTRLTGSAAKEGYVGPGQQGVVEKMLGPGRHFLNPWEYATREVADFEVPPGHIALLRNNVGRELPEGRFLAGPEEKGTQRRVLTPGVWRLNEFGQSHYVQAALAAKGLQTQPQVFVPPGYVGVQTLAEGKEKEKGILPTVLQAGYYTLNPEEIKVRILGIGYDVLDLHVTYETQSVRDKNGVIRTVQRPKDGTGVAFPLADGKQMYLDVTVVWGVFPEDAPRVVGEYGTLEMLEEKIILPQVLSICKNAGSDLTTQNFIEGSTREQFQERFTNDLQKIGKEKGIHFLIALVRGFHPDVAITETIQAKMLAEEEIISLGFEKQRDAVAAELESARRRVMTALSDFDANTDSMVAEEREEGLKAAALLRAEADRRVAAINKQVAELNAQATQINGKAEADVQERKSRAEADLLRLLISAYGGADVFNLATFAKNLPEDLKVEYRYSGPGTLWTDVQGDLQKMAARKILSEKK